MTIRSFVWKMWFIYGIDKKKDVVKRREKLSYFKLSHLPSLVLSGWGKRRWFLARAALEAKIKLVKNLPKYNTATSVHKWRDKCINWFSINDLRAPEQRGSHISVCFKDRKIVAYPAYFTVIFDAVITSNPTPYWPASVTSGTDPRF